MTCRQKKRFRRITTPIIIITLIMICAFMSCSGTENPGVMIEPQQEEQRIDYAGYEFYEVGPFETLSSIATKYIPSDDYMQEWIRDVQRLNNRNNSTIYFGEVIKVYVYEK